MLMTRTIRTRLALEFLVANYFQMPLRFTMRGFANSRADLEASGAYDCTRLPIAFTNPSESAKISSRIKVSMKSGRRRICHISQ